jgi:hypothetical protein
MAGATKKTTVAKKSTGTPKKPKAKQAAAKTKPTAAKPKKVAAKAKKSVAPKAKKAPALSPREILFKQFEVRVPDKLYRPPVDRDKTVVADAPPVIADRSPGSKAAQGRSFPQVRHG